MVAVILKNRVTEEARTLPVYAEVGVLVVGGGSAGWHAAVAAARNGAHTLLIERHGTLGGTVTNAMVQPFMNFHSPVGEAVVAGIWQEMLDRMQAHGATTGPLPSSRGKAPWGKKPTLTPFDPEFLKFVAQELVLGSGADLLLHTMVVDTIMEENILKGVVIENKSGRQAVLSNCVIDASGDADIAAFSGAPFMFGRESDQLTMPMSLYIKMRGIDYEELGKYVEENPEEFRWWSFPEVDPSFPDGVEKKPVSCSGFLTLVREGRATGELLLGRETINILPCPKKGEVVLNCTRIGNLDPTNGSDITKAEIEARRQAMSTVNWVPNNLPGFRKAELVAVAPVIGVRESRRIIGEYTLTVEDVVSGRKFDDRIARSAYNVDIHNPSDDKSTWYEIEDAYDIPYRCLVPQKIENLLVAGRCISTTHEASGSARMTPHVAATGEAAGTAAAIAVASNISVRQVDVKALQVNLVESNANLGSYEVTSALTK